MKNLIVFTMLFSLLSVAAIAHAEEAASSRSLNGYDGGAVFEKDVETDYLLDG